MQNLHNFKFVGCLLVCLLLLSLSACDKKPDLPDLEEFTRADREKLGEFIQWEFENNAFYNILPKTAPYDTLYWYTQTLYNQANSVIKRDQQSPSNNRWNQNREWVISIIKMDKKTAFVLPGGDLYLSTGLLKSLEKEYELYYFLAFEANLMHEDFLLKRMVREYNSITLRNVISGSAPANSTTLHIIAEDLPTLDFQSQTVESIDRLAVATICQTSIYNRIGIAPFLLDANNDDAPWLHSRRSYNGRAQHLAEIEVAGNFDCGDFKGDGQYGRYVLAVLEN